MSTRAQAGPVPAPRGCFLDSYVWRCVIDALPQLPDELQYRVMGRDLALLDTHVDPMVGILRNAVR
jgi:hypothetical protein